MNTDGKVGWKVPNKKGQQLIVLHASGVEGWVMLLTWYLLLTQTVQITTMKRTMNITWNVLMNITTTTTYKPSVIILHNALCHNRGTNHPLQRTKMMTYRNGSKNTIYSTWIQALRNTTVYSQTTPTEPIYYTDEAVHEYGHLVLRLLVTHYELNPVEFTWATLKGYVPRENNNTS